MLAPLPSFARRCASTPVGTVCAASSMTSSGTIATTFGSASERAPLAGIELGGETADRATERCGRRCTPSRACRVAPDDARRCRRRALSIDDIAAGRVGAAAGRRVGDGVVGDAGRRGTAAAGGGRRGRGRAGRGSPRGGRARDREPTAGPSDAGSRRASGSAPALATTRASAAARTHRAALSVATWFGGDRLADHRERGEHSEGKGGERASTHWDAHHRARVHPRPRTRWSHRPVADRSEPHQTRADAQVVPRGSRPRPRRRAPGCSSASCRGPSRRPSSRSRSRSAAT